MASGIPREQIERAARVYKTNLDAGRALDISVHHFSRLCRRYGIETPYARRRRSIQDARH
ncbi:MAG: hypothetical protein ACI906_004141 [Candidatus Latescibacterota bacterium]|jgi:hypothetical protein